RRVNRLKSRFGRVPAVEIHERRRIERLHADRESRNAGACVRRKPRAVEILRVGLERNLGAGREREDRTELPYERREEVSLDERRRAAAEVKRLERGHFRQRRLLRARLTQHRGQITLAPPRLIRSRHEVAEAAPPRAERNVHIQPAHIPPHATRRNRKSLHHPSESIRSTARNASCGISTVPICFIRRFPSFCFSSSFRLR